jgi:fermentation-respiration switch protein FrsA (DUF1100 family)
MQADQSIGILKLILTMAILSYLGLVMFALLFANRLVFPAPPPGYSDSPEIRKFRFNGDGDSVSMLLLNNPSSPWLVFYNHGNGEDLQGILPRLQGLRQAGYSILAWDYPGYGTSSGKPSEGLVIDIAAKIWEQIPELTGYDHSRVILYGRSLGGGPATWIARNGSPAGLVLEGVFTSTFRVGLPVKLLPWDIFDNLALIDSIRCPLLVLHGTRDGTVPFRHGVRLFEKASDPKFFAWFEGGRHNNLIEEYPEIYYSSLSRFRDFLTSHNHDGSR